MLHFGNENKEVKNELQTTTKLGKLRMTKERLYSECCICRQIRKETHSNWYYPTAQERQEHYNQGIRLSHGFCEKCLILWERKELGLEEMK